MRKLIATLSFLLAALPLALFSVVSVAQGFIPEQAPPWVFADNYGRWALQGQNANTWTFSPAVLCQITQLNYKNKPTFYAFSNTLALAPVLISDNNQALSEVVTPGSYFAPTQTTCGANLAPANSHTTFTLQSGTGGLQEALNAVGGTTAPYITRVFLTKEWYAAVAGIASQNAVLAVSAQPQKIIGTVTGSSQANLVDITTTPETVYAWNGSQYAVVQGQPGFPNQGVLSYTQIAAPTALSTASTTTGIITTSAAGGTIPASSTYRLAATYVDASGGETLISTDSASTATIATGTGSTNSIAVTSPAASTGAVGWRIYMSAASGAAGSEILYTATCSATTSKQPLQTTFVSGTVCPIGSTATITAVVTGTATVPPTGSAYQRTGGVSGAFPPFTALGTVAAAGTGTLAVVNLPAGYLNSLGRSFEVCGNGNATTNATPGTLTLAIKVASVPGVTTITPFTAVSGTTTASAVVSYNFCVTFTTAATGTTGTLETHGWVSYGLAGTAPGTISQDIIVAVSSTVDLTKQDQLDFTITPTTTALTAAQQRQTSFIPIS